MGLGLLSAGLGAEPESAGEGNVLKVGVIVSPPFVMKNAAGHWEGVAFSLWEGIASALGIACEYREMDPVDVVLGLRDGVLDVGLGRFIPSAELDQMIDFTCVYYFAGLGIAVGQKGDRRHWLEVARNLKNSDFMYISFLLMGVMFLSGVMLWWLERRHNKDHFGGNVVSGIGSGIWWAMTTLTTVGYGDKVPVTIMGRSIALVAMLVGIVLIACFTATVTSLSTASRLYAQVADASDLKDWRVGVMTNTMGTIYLRRQKVPYEVFQSTPEALRALIDGKLDAVVQDLPVLQYYARQIPFRTLDILPNRLLQEGYTLAIPKESPLRARLNTAILEQMRQPAWNDILFRYLGE